MLFEKIIKDPKDIVFVYTICPTKEESKKLGIMAIKKRLVISIDYWFIDSIYPWRGILQEVKQYMVLFVTKKITSYKLMKFIEREHTYITPMIIRSDIAIANAAYELWVNDTLEKKEELKVLPEDINKAKGDV